MFLLQILSVVLLFLGLKIMNLLWKLKIGLTNLRKNHRISLKILFEQLKSSLAGMKLVLKLIKRNPTNL